MGLRSDLHNVLKGVLGSSNVYFQPPESINLKFPCIVYKRNFESTKYADDGTYLSARQYMVTVIDPNPDSLIPDKVSKLPNCSFVRFFTKDNLNHDIYNLYF